MWGLWLLGWGFRGGDWWDEGSWVDKGGGNEGRNVE